MSDTLNALKGIKPLFKRGETFYYANRQWRIQQKNDASGETFKCYHDFGCFASKQEAYDDAQIEADRIIY